MCLGGGGGGGGGGGRIGTARRYIPDNISEKCKHATTKNETSLGTTRSVAEHLCSPTATRSLLGVQHTHTHTFHTSDDSSEGRSEFGTSRCGATRTRVERRGADIDLLRSCCCVGCGVRRWAVVCVVRFKNELCTTALTSSDRFVVKVYSAHTHGSRQCVLNS